MEIANHLNKPNYEGWAQMDFWPMNCAIDLIAAYLGEEAMGHDSLKFIEAFDKNREFVKRIVGIGINNNDLKCSVCRWESEYTDEPDVSYLNTVVDKDSFLRFVKDRGLNVQEDLWHSVRPEGYERKLRSEQETKLICQGIAIALWDSNPDMTIAEMIKQEVLLEKGGGNFYGEKTIRGWVSEVDPRPSEKKTGPKPKK